MKKYSILFIIILAVFIIASCDMGPGKIETREDAEFVSNIVFDASYSGIAVGCSGTVTETNCVTSNLIDGGSIEFCVGDEEVLSNSVFYSGLDLENGCVLSAAFNDAHVTYPPTSGEYILDGGIALFEDADFLETSIEIVSVVYGSVDIQGDEIVDTAEFDVKYTCTAAIVDNQIVISGTVEGTVNGIDITDNDWEYVITP
jgi:hypothetical protein